MKIFLLLILAVSYNTKNIEKALKEGNISKADSIAHRIVKETDNPYILRRIYFLYRRYGFEDEGLDLLKEGRAHFKDETLFAQEFYIYYARHRDYENAFYELLNLAGGGSIWAERELTRYINFLGTRKVEKIVKRWGKKTGKPIDEILAKVYIDRGLIDKAIKVLKGERDSLLMELSKEALIKGKPDVALEALKKIKIESGEREFLIASAYKIKGKYKDALNHYMKADSLGYPAKDSIASILINELGKPEDALTLTDISSHFRLDALIKLGRFEEADTSVCGFFQDPETIYRCILVKEILGKREELDSLSKIFLKKYPKSDYVNDVLFILYEMNEMMNRWDVFVEVKKAYLMGEYGKVEKLVKKHPEDAHLLIYLGLALEREGRANESYSIFKKVGEKKELRGAYALYKASLVALNELGDKKLAEETLKELILKFPETPYAEVAREMLNELRTQGSFLIKSNTAFAFFFNSSLVPLFSIV